MERHRPRDNRTLSQEVFEKRASNNPYLKHIYEYPAFILPHPSAPQFKLFWQSHYSPEKKVYVDIGCGSGRYLFELCRMHPHALCIGFELRYKRLVLAAKKFQQLKCDNAFLIKDKGEFLNEYFAPETISCVSINFPDPWSKRAQRKNRLLSEEFFAKLYPLMRPQGSLFFKTDHQEYFQEVLRISQQLSQYQVEIFTNDLHRSVYSEGNIETEFESLFRSKGNPPIGYLKLQVLKTLPIANLK